jgi:hypothetical protein
LSGLRLKNSCGTQGSRQRLIANFAVISLDVEGNPGMKWFIHVLLQREGLLNWGAESGVLTIDNFHMAKVQKKCGTVHSRMEKF